MRWGIGIAFGLSCITYGGAAHAADPGIDAPLEELLNTEVSSVLKHTSGLADAPAATTVLRREDIERLGATTLPDILRTVPGLSVSQIDGNKWAIGARGFNGFFGSKLLVLIDGRSIYNSTFSGVFWDAHDIPLDNIARIEIIRGPQAALWGSNAVNGVINIVTRSAQETQGGRVALSAGSTLHHAVDVRQGGENEALAWRLYARSRNQGDYRLAGGDRAGDTSRGDRVGFRVDSAPGRSAWMITGETYSGRSGGAPYPEPTTDDFNGYHLLGRYNQRLNNDSTLQVQAYVDHAWRKDLAVGSVLQEDVADLDLQYSREFGNTHRLTLGGGWRQYHFDSASSYKLGFTPASSTQSIGNLFIQDEWSLVPREFQIVAGLRAESLYDYGVFWQPTLKAVWTPTAANTFWASSSKAVRAPNKVDTAIRYTGPVGSSPLPPVYGNPNFVPEEVVSLELGWRSRINARLSSDLSLFQNHYRQLETIEAVSPWMLSYFNHGRATTAGIEWALDWQATDVWQLRSGLTLYREDLTYSGAVSSLMAVHSFRASQPNYQGFIRSLWDISRRHRLDVTLRGMGPMSERGVKGYATSDIRWTWQAQRDLQFSLIGRNIGGPRHSELGDQPFFQETLVGPEVIGSVVWTY